MLDCNPILVKDCFGNDDWNWTRILGDEATFTIGLGPNISALKDRVSNLKVDQQMDAIEWRWCSSGVFSVKSAYRIPLTIDNLVKRGWTGDTVCVLCQVHDKSVDHLFTQCVFTKYIMLMGLEDVYAEELGDNVLIVWDKWMEKSAVRGRSNGPSDLVACWWTIWKARNNLIFRNQQLDPVLAAQRLKLLLSTWKELL
uniref:Reverse transcriptase zinc-binding domain-containing protein n=1 Tax=Ananas comosus var. bracteatus TaxID=296719 RepID=A0A6V7QSX2_ANACO